MIRVESAWAEITTAVEVVGSWAAACVGFCDCASRDGWATRHTTTVRISDNTRTAKSVWRLKLLRLRALEDRPSAAKCVYVGS